MLFNFNFIVSDLYKDKGLFERLTYIEADFPGANIIMHKEGKLTKVCMYLPIKFCLYIVSSIKIGATNKKHWSHHKEDKCKEFIMFSAIYIRFKHISAQTVFMIIFSTHTSHFAECLISSVNCLGHSLDKIG